MLDNSTLAEKDGAAEAAAEGDSKNLCHIASDSSAGAGALAFEQLEPQRLWLLAPSRGGIQGEYALQKGRDKQGQPLWRQVVGSGWLFSTGSDGFWCFASNEADLVQKLGHIQSVEPHSGCFAHEVASWQYHDGSAWHTDVSICVFTSREAFDAAASAAVVEDYQICYSSLWLLAPPYLALQGEYRKQEARHERGQPVWRQVGGDGWIFSTTKGRWFVTEGEAGIAVNGGVIATTTPHNGALPHEMQHWQYFHDGTWHPDSSVFISEKQAEAEHRLAEQKAEALRRACSAPEQVWLICPPKPLLQGEYVRQPGRVERGQAVWRQSGGQGILYSLGGLWCVATKESDVAKNLGLLQCAEPHKGQGPHEVEDWQFADGNVWRADRCIWVTADQEKGLRALAEQETEAQKRALSAPQQLWLKASSKPALEGQYAKVSGRIERGQAIWHQLGGSGWLYSSAGGRWFVADREDAVTQCGGVIASSAPHQGRYPHETERWQQYDDGVWKFAPSISVVAEMKCFNISDMNLSGESITIVTPTVIAMDMPSSFWVLAPQFPALEGEYVQQSNRVMQGQPVWANIDGGAMLFNLQEGVVHAVGNDANGSSARWCLATNESEAVNGRPVLRGTPHAGSSPLETSTWQRFEGGGWLDETFVSILADEASFKLAQSEAAKRKHVENVLLQAEDVEDDPRPEVVKPGANFFQNLTAAPGLPMEKMKAITHHSSLAGNDAVPVGLLPTTLRDRVGTEVKELLSRANLGRDQQQADVNEDALVEQCYEAVLSAKARGIDVETNSELLSKEVMRTILMGWDHSKRRGVSIDVGTEHSISPQIDLGEELDGVCVDEGCLSYPRAACDSCRVC
eukprot:TRINITY_DN33431_c0_g1_i1.p1 TRINITY_DN33431_c0_g1~~TRINITY_DN33431_c0_g1_i1.p1  ORF type:complete len:855 (+),score=147.81 TRINITY_DN33431_c0_g1_i1:29-2593(+)